MIAGHLPQAEIKVVPRSMGPYYTMLLDENGNSEEGFDDTSWGFIEVGQFTTDFAMVERGHVVDRSFDSCHGMRVAAEQLQRLILEDFRAKITLSEATDMLAKPVLRSFGRQIDVTEQVVKSAKNLSTMIADKAVQFFGENVRSLSGIRVAGGGAPLIRDAVAAKWADTGMGQLPEDFVSVMPNSRFAVAEGFLRFSLGLQMIRSGA
jgi:plasmid segregation protein ParM